MSSIVVVSIPWEYLKGEQFEDLQVYIQTYNELQQGHVKVFDLDNKLSILLNSEFLWKYILFGLGYLGFDAVLSLKIISFICFAFISYFVFKHVGFHVSALLLYNPLIIDFVMSQQRSALAFSIFLLSLSSKRVSSLYIMMFCAVFIHTASVVLYSSYFFAKYLESRFSLITYRKNLRNILLIFIVMLFLISSKQAVLSFIGDRRAYLEAVQVSFLFSMVWMLVSVYFILFSRISNSNYIYLYLFFAFDFLFLIGTFSGEYSLRFLTFAVPFLIISLASFLRRIEFCVIFYLIISYQFIQWVYWWKFFQ